MKSKNRTHDGQPRDAKRASRGSKSKAATLARRAQRDAKRIAQGR